MLDHYHFRQRGCVAALAWWRALEAKCAEVLETSLPSRALGRGNKPDPLTDLGQPAIDTEYRTPFRIVPERGKVPENDVEPSPKKRGNVLHDDVAGSKFANKTGVLPPKSRSLAVDARAFAGERDILAGKSAANNVDCFNVCSFERAHVVENGNIGPVLRQHAARELFDLAKGDRLEAARAFEAQREPANAGKKIQHSEFLGEFWYDFRHDQTLKTLRILRDRVSTRPSNSQVVLNRMQGQVSLATEEGWGFDEASLSPVRRRFRGTITSRCQPMALFVGMFSA